MTRWVVVLIAMSISAGRAAAATDCGDGTALAAELVGQPVTTWTNDTIRRNAQRGLDFALHCVFGQASHEGRFQALLPDKLPAVRVELTHALDSPYAAGSEIVFPVDYLRYLFVISAVTGHDVYQTIAHQGTDVNQPLLTTPFRKARIFPLLDQPGQLSELLVAEQLQSHVGCPSANEECGSLAGMANVGLCIFVLAHEISHIALGHVVSSEGVNVDQEIAADINAYGILLQIHGRLKPTEALALLAAPMVWLKAESARTSPADVVAKARLAALEARLDESQRRDVDALISADVSNNAVVDLLLTSREAPVRLFIDGVSFDPREAMGRVLTVTNARHLVIAARRGRLAAAFSRPAEEGHSVDMPLEFRAIAPPHRQSVQAAVKAGNWLSVLLQCSDEQLQPRSPDLAMYHWQALHELGVDSLIRPARWEEIPVAEWGRILDWQRGSEPLQSWY